MKVILLEIKTRLHFPGPSEDRMTDLTRQCLCAFHCSMLSLTSKLKYGRIEVPSGIIPTRGWTVKNPEPESPVRKVCRRRFTDV